jgi:hypothetical protein
VGLKPIFFNTLLDWGHGVQYKGVDVRMAKQHRLELAKEMTLERLCEEIR